MKYNIERLVKPFLYASLALLVLWLPVIISNRLFIDDIGRSARGYYDWGANGRPLTDALFYFLNSGMSVIDASPAYQLAAIVVMGLCCISFLIALNIEIKWNTVLASLLIFSTPYYIANIIYRFDALSMAISCLASIWCFYLSRSFKNIPKYILGLILGVVYLSFYQAFMSIYIIMAMYIALNEDKLSRGLKSVIPLIVSLLLYYLAYSKLIAPIFINGYYNTAHSDILLSVDNFTYNIKMFANMQSDLLKGSQLAFFLLILVPPLLLIAYDLIKREGTACALWKMPLMLLMLAIPTLIYLPLKHPVFDPRVLAGFGAAICIIFIKAFDSRFIKCGATLLVLYLFSIFTVSCAYRVASNELDAYERSKAFIISEKIKEINSNKIVYFGTVDKPSITKRIDNHFPIVGHMTRPFLDNDSWWGKLLLENYGVNKFSLKNGPERDEIKKLSCSSGLNKAGVHSVNGVIVVSYNDWKC